MTQPRSTLDDEPRIVLPTGRMVGATILASVAFAGAWWGACAAAGWPADVIRSGVVAATVVAVVAIVATVATVPWMPKAASTALLAWLAGSVLRMLGVLTVALLLYSAPPAGALGGLAGARTAFLLAIALSFLLGLLVEVGVVASSVLRQPPSSKTAGG